MRKLLTLFILANSFHLTAQNNDIAKSHFISAKMQLENMLSGKEKPEFEKGIFIIENAWYENQIDKKEYDFALQTHINTIQEIIKKNYNLSAIEQKPNYLFTQKQLDERYTKAITNWAIYNFMTHNICFIDSNNASVHYSYHYSNNDPMGTEDWRNTQVINLNNTKYGNCFALASMFKILSDRLHSEATLCTAPSHIYIRHADEKGTKYNVELGTQNFPGTGTISTITYSTDQAIQNNISQRELSDKQAISLCLVYLAKGYEHRFHNCDDAFILECAETALKYDSRNLNALLLKAEYLENKLTSQNKSVSSFQSDKDFQNYQSLIANLYNLGYREMPLDMKNLIMRTYQKDKTLSTSVFINPVTPKGRYATVSWGMFDERHEIKTIERIGNTIFNTSTKKITSFAKRQKLYSNYNFDPVVFAWNIDPMFAKHPGMSPYHFAVNNPIVFNDPDGNTEFYFNNKWVGSDGKKNNLIALVKSGDVKRQIKENTYKSNGVLSNGTNNKDMFVIDATVLSTATNVLNKGLTEGKNREFGTRLNKGDKGYEMQIEGIQQGAIVDLASAKQAHVEIAGSGGVLIHSHPTGEDYNEKTNIIKSADASNPSDDDANNMDNVEMSIIVGKNGEAKATKWEEGYMKGVDISKRDAYINVFNKDNKETPVESIKKEDAEAILKDFKKR